MLIILVLVNLPLYVSCTILPGDVMLASVKLCRSPTKIHIY